MAMAERPAGLETAEAPHDPPSAPATPSASSRAGHRVITVNGRASRASISLSAQEDLLLRRTSLVLSSSSGVVETVLSQSELARLRKFGSKYLGRHRANYQDARTASALSTASLARNQDDRHSRTATHQAPVDQDTDAAIHNADDSPRQQLPDELSTPLHDGEQDPPWLASLRVTLRRAVKRDWFRAALYAVVLVDMVVLAMDNEYYTGSALAQLDVACTLLLLLEVALKAVAFGLFSGPLSYFGRSRYRFLNVALLLASLLSHLGSSTSQWKVLRGLKMARSLTLYAGLRRILKALARAVPFLANVGTLSLFGLLAFSIFGLEAYNGSFDSQCAAQVSAETGSDASGGSDLTSAVVLAALPRVYCSSNSSCAANTQFCYAAGPPSKNINFDSGVRSFFLVFLVVAQDGWVTDIMEPVVEATSTASLLFFVAIVASMVFLVVNLFVAVITTAFMNFTVDDETNDARPRCMGKMDPDVEETHVNMIMGATLVLEESILATERKASADQIVADTAPPPVDEDSATTSTTALVVHQSAIDRHRHEEHAAVATTLKVRPSSAPASTAVTPQGKRSRATNGCADSTLRRTHKWHTLRNLTVDTTIRLIHDGFPVEQLAEALAAVRPGLVDDEGNPMTSRLLLENENAVANLAPRKSSVIKVPGFIDTASPQVTASSDALVLASASASKPTSRSFAAFQRLVLSKKFEDAITLCIVANTFFLLLEYEGMSSTLSSVLSVTEYLFGGIFLAEMLACIAAMRGLRNYLYSTERVFDAVVVLCTSVNMLLSNVSTTSYSGLHSASSLRTLRVGRLIMKYEGTRKLIESILKSSRGVVDVVVFMLLFQVVNSIIGMQLFGGSHLRNEDETPRWNFDTFGRSFLTLLQVITGDQWSSIAYDAVNASDPHWFMVPFLVINFVVGQYVLLNLFIAVILENFRSCYLKDDVCSISLLDFEAYREVFMRFDTHGNGVFPLWQLPSFLAELPPGLRVGPRAQRSAFLQIRAQAQAQLECARAARRRPYFNELLRILCIHQMGIRSLPYEQQRDRVKQIFIFRSKVARMLVDSVVRGYVQRFRMRRVRKREREAQLAQKRREVETQTDGDARKEEDVVVGRTDCGSLIVRQDAQPRACNASTQTIEDDASAGSESESVGDETREDGGRRHHRRKKRRHRHHDGCRHADKHRRSTRDKVAKVLPDLALGDGDERSSVAGGDQQHAINANDVSGAASEISTSSAAAQATSGAKHLPPLSPHLREQEVSGGNGNDDGTLVPKQVAEQSGNRRVKLAALPPSSKVLPFS